MPPTFASLLDQHIGTVFARQLLWADYLQIKQEPAIDLDKGIVTFNNGLTFSIQLLGTQLDLDNTWLWAWADEANSALFPSSASSDFHAPFPPALLQDAQKIKTLGQAQGIDQLSHPKLVLDLSTSPLTPDEFNGDHIACVAAGLLNTVYWRDTRDEGVVYYLIENLPEQLTTPCTAPHILESIEQVSSYFATDNKIMVQSFLSQQGFSVSWPHTPQATTSSANAESEEALDEDDEDPFSNATTTLLARRGTEEITATFDAQAILTEIEAHGFEGEENYAAMNEDSEDDDNSFNPFTSGAGGMNNVLTQWGNSSDDEMDAEFPPKLP